jgi:hypothetical protein
MTAVRHARAPEHGMDLAETHRDPESIRAGVRHVLSETGYRDAAGRLRAAMTDLPGMATAVSMLERLATTHAPIWRGAGSRSPIGGADAKRS